MYVPAAVGGVLPGWRRYPIRRSTSEPGQRPRLAAGELSLPEPAIVTDAGNGLPSYPPPGSLSFRVGVAFKTEIAAVTVTEP